MSLFQVWGFHYLRKSIIYFRLLFVSSIIKERHMITPEQKLAARKAIQLASSLLQSIEQEAEQDNYDVIPHLLVRLDGAFFDLRLTLGTNIQSAQKPTSASIMDEYEDNV
jgi:hypothetical protein